MELLHEFEKMIADYLAPSANRHAVDLESLEDEVGGLVADLLEFSGMSDVRGYVIPLDPLDASTAVRWLDKYCTRYDDEGDPEAWIPSDFSFIALLFDDFRLCVIQPVDVVPTFESWSSSL